MTPSDNEFVHNHGPSEGSGLSCPETRLPDGSLRGACMDGLRDKYRVERHDDPTGKHNDCRYFVLDPQHDPIAREALTLYAELTPNDALRKDLRGWLKEGKPMRCKHLRTRSIHGDEVWARMKVFTLRWWKAPVVHRRACLDCGKALDRGTAAKVL